MKKLMYLLLLALPLSIHAEDQKPISTATICFYRPHRFEGSALKPPLFVDDIDVAHLHNGDAVEIVVLAGPHRVNSNDKSTGIDLDAKAGQTYYIRVDIKTGAWKGHGAMTLVDPQQGKYEFSKQKISVTKNLGFGATGTPMEAVSQPPAPTTGSALATPPVKEGGEAEGIATVAVSTSPDGQTFTLMVCSWAMPLPTLNYQPEGTRFVCLSQTTKTGPARSRCMRGLNLD